MSIFNTSEVAFGLDFSDGNLRLVQLKKTYQKIKVQHYNEIPLPAGCVKDGLIIQPKIFLDSLNKLIKTSHGRGHLSDEVISVLPEEKTFLKVIEIPKTAENEIKKKIEEILPQHLPINIGETYLDWQIVKEKESSQTILVGACDKKIIDSYAEILGQANLVPTVLEIEAGSIAHLLMEQNNDHEPQIVIDIGASRTGLFLYDQDTVKFTVSLPISGNKITQTIEEAVDLDWAKAEQAKIVCGLDPQKCNGAVLEIFGDTIEELATQIKKAIDFYYNSFTQTEKIKKIVLTGGGANFLNIAQTLNQKINLPTAISNPWQNIINPDPCYFTPQKSQSFVTAIGLALRGLKAETFL